MKEQNMKNELQFEKELREIFDTDERWKDWAEYPHNPDFKQCFFFTHDAALVFNWTLFRYIAMKVKELLWTKPHNLTARNGESKRLDMNATHGMEFKFQMLPARYVVEADVVTYDGDVDKGDIQVESRVLMCSSGGADAVYKTAYIVLIPNDSSDLELILQPKKK